MTIVYEASVNFLNRRFDITLSIPSYLKDMANRFRLRPGTQLLLLLLAMTLAIWILRGIGLLTFLPGIVIWLLLLIVVAVTVINSLQSVR